MPHETTPQSPTEKLIASRLREQKESRGQIIQPERAKLTTRVGPGTQPAPIRRQAPEATTPGDVARMSKGQPMTARPKDERRGASILEGFDFGLPCRVAYLTSAPALAASQTLTIPAPPGEGRILIEKWRILATTQAVGSPTVSIDTFITRDGVFIPGEQLPVVALPLGMGLFTELDLVEPPEYIVTRPGTSAGVRVTSLITGHFVMQIATYRISDF